MDWKQKEKEKNAAMKSEAYEDVHGVWRWKSNNNVPFEDMLLCWNLDLLTLQKCIYARKADTEKFFEEYRKQMENYEPSPEELFEMRAAFGEGVKVVNVLTGKTTQL
jgi:hypothetical protein